MLGSKRAMLGITGFYFTDTVSTVQTNYNVYSKALTYGWNSIIPVFGTIYINSWVGSTSTGLYAFICSGLPIDSRITLVVNGYIVGAGGNGAQGSGASDYGIHYDGNYGGHAIYTNNNIDLYMSSGYIAGGGGGGGGGAMQYVSAAPLIAGGGGGGGGRGYIGGTGGPAFPNSGTDGSNVAAGTGGGGQHTSGAGYVADGGDGGAGGNWGTAGSAGGNSGDGWPGGSGGAAGYSIVGNNYISYRTAVTLYGPTSNLP